ncbi:MAG: sel1 repeat family protein, partial [Gammaproteobacteria bacterium]|nr:sel1 repeat family protein [Gammaproteobacteria bacterium]
MSPLSGNRKTVLPRRHHGGTSGGATPDRKFVKAPAPIWVLVFITIWVAWGLYVFFVWNQDDSKPTVLVSRDLAAAEDGNAYRQYLVGIYYTEGRQGLEPDINVARRWFEASAAQNYVPAIYRLGDIHRHGDGVERDMGKAISLFRQAAEGGSYAARNAMGDLYRDSDGVEKDMDEALAWYRRAAEAGYAPAQRNMGLMMAGGLGMPRDYHSAMRWYRKSVEQGDPLAANNMGIMYEH